MVPNTISWSLYLTDKSAPQFQDNGGYISESAKLQNSPKYWEKIFTFGFTLLFIQVLSIRKSIFTKFMQSKFTLGKS